MYEPSLLYVSTATKEDAGYQIIDPMNRRRYIAQNICVPAPQVEARLQRLENKVAQGTGL